MVYLPRGIEKVKCFRLKCPNFTRENQTNEPLDSKSRQKPRELGLARGRAVNELLSCQSCRKREACVFYRNVVFILHCS